jgi:hypothetical protein
VTTQTAAGGQPDRLSSDRVSVRVGADDVIRVRWTEGITLTEADARTAQALVDLVSADRRLPLLMDMTATAAVTRPARAAFAELGAASIIALLGGHPWTA